MTVSQAFRAAFQVYTAGDATLKASATGFALIGAALSDVVGGVVFAVLTFFWLMDMFSGALRAIAEHGFSGFSFGRFMTGFVKLGAAMIGIGLGVGSDVLIANIVGMSGPMVTTGAMAGIAFGFGASAAENLTYWFPDTAGKLNELLNRGKEASDKQWSTFVAGMSEEGQTKIRAIMEEERAR